MLFEFPKLYIHTHIKVQKRGSTYASTLIHNRYIEKHFYEIFQALIKFVLYVLETDCCVSPLRILSKYVSTCRAEVTFSQCGTKYGIPSTSFDGYSQKFVRAV